MNDYPQALVDPGHVEPVPRRIRAELGGQVVLDTTRAIYMWEWPLYPQFHIPSQDVDARALIDGGPAHHLRHGTVVTVGLSAGGVQRPKAGRRYLESPIAEIVGHIRFEWDALDAWFEEDEQVFVHPRNPYVRVDALRSTRNVRIERDGFVLAESDAPVLVFETGVPTRYYLDRSAIDFSRLRASDTVTACPYKGVTTGYWSVAIGDALHRDFAWTYSFPTRQLLPIAGLIAFYNEQVDIFLDGAQQPRPRTHFFT